MLSRGNTNTRLVSKPFEPRTSRNLLHTVSRPIRGRSQEGTRTLSSAHQDHERESGIPAQRLAVLDVQAQPSDACRTSDPTTGIRREDGPWRRTGEKGALGLYTLRRGKRDH